jgi:hypothetical protein
MSMILIIHSFVLPLSVFVVFCNRLLFELERCVATILVAILFRIPSLISDKYIAEL